MSRTRGTIDRDSLRAHDEWVRRKRQGEGRLDVAGLDASGIDLHGKELTAARFEGVNLREGFLAYATLNEATLIDCNLDRAQLKSTDLQGAELRDCSCQDVAAEIAKLDRAVVHGARFDRANLQVSQWAGAKVSATSFAQAALRNATLDGASFVDCDFRGAWLGPAGRNPPHSMRGATFDSCDFRGADFTRAMLDGATFKNCKFRGARGEPCSTADVSVSASDVSASELVRLLEECLTLEQVLAHPGVLVAARDSADPTRTAVFVVDRSAHLLTRLPLTRALDHLRQGATFGRSGVLWAWDAESLSVWDFEQKALEVRGDSIEWGGGTVERSLVTRIVSFINPDRLGNRGVRLVLVGHERSRITIVQDQDLAADKSASYTRADARRDGMWASHLGRYLAGWLGVPHDDDFA